MAGPIIQEIRFQNYKALRDTTLPLERLTILIGPNGSGKSTALEGIGLPDLNLKTLTVGLPEAGQLDTAILARAVDGGTLGRRMARDRAGAWKSRDIKTAGTEGPRQANRCYSVLQNLAIYSLDAPAIAKPVALEPDMRLGPKGEKLAGVLDGLRDEHPERFEALNEELGRWIPEFDRVLFATPQGGHRAIQLRRRREQKPIPAADVSQGTLLALAILTLAYLPDPPPIIGLEEPGRGIHPRLLRDVRDAIYRLVYPERFGEDREPVQVVCTTHSPYFLDLFRDEPESIVIANKTEDNVQFTRLMDLPNIEEILGQTPPLGELWYSGVLGGVPAGK